MELSEATEWLSERVRYEHSPIPSPLTPPLENANEHAKICLGNWFEYLDILAHNIHSVKRFLDNLIFSKVGNFSGITPPISTIVCLTFLPTSKCA